MKQAISYRRVSTPRQGETGYGLGDQRGELDRFYEQEKEITEVAEFVDVASGKDSNRPELLRAIAKCQEIGAVLVFPRQDRLARKVSFIANLMESTVEFIDIEHPRATPFELHIRAAVNEEEGRKISENTKRGLAQAKMAGVKLGASNPKYQGHKTKQARARKFAETIRPILDGLPPMFDYEIIEELNRREIPTPSGRGKWHKTTLHRVRASLDKPAP